MYASGHTTHTVKDTITHTRARARARTHTATLSARLSIMLCCRSKKLGQFKTIKNAGGCAQKCSQTAGCTYWIVHNT